MDVDDQWGFIDKRGIFKIEPAFDEALSFSEDLAAVMIDGLWGFIDKSGRIVINPRFESARSFSGGLAPAKEQGLWGLIGTDGHYFIKPRWQDLSGFIEGYARAVTPQGQVRLIDAFGLEAPIQGDRAREAARRAGAETGLGERSDSLSTVSGGGAPEAPTLELSVKVTDYRTGKPLEGFYFASALGDYGERELPVSKSGSDGMLRLRLDEALYAQTVELYGGDGFYPCTLSLGNHQDRSLSVAALPLDAELPRLDQVVLSGEGESSSSDILTRQVEYEFNKPGQAKLRFEAYAGDLKIRSYFLQQGTRRIESSSPSFSLEPGKAFVPGEIVYAGVVTDYQSMPLITQTMIKLRKNPALEKPIELPKSPGALLPSDIPFAGGQKGMLQLPFLKFSVEYDNDKILIYIGMSADAVKEQGHGWQGPFKSFVSDAMAGMRSLREIQHYAAGLGPEPRPEGVGVFRSSAGALGYIELGYGAKGLEVLSGASWSSANSATSLPRR